MNKRYRLGEIEEAVSEMEELIDIEDDIAEIDDEFQIVVSGWSVYVESLNLTLRQEMPEFSVTVTPYEREGSNIKGLARIYFENSFIVNNINIVQGKEKIFVSMPSYKTKQVDEQGKPIYQDVCYPVTKDFREKLYNEIISEYEKAKDKSNEKARESAEKHHGNPDKEKDKEATPFR